MICVFCKRAEPAVGTTSMTYERGEAVIVVRKIPALVCPACGEAYFDEATSSRLDVIVGEALRGGGVQFALREYVAAEPFLAR